MGKGGKIMPCEKCGIELTESNMNVWLTEGRALCIRCESELKVLKTVIGNIRYFSTLISSHYRKKLAKVFEATYDHFENRNFGGFNET